MEKWNSIKFNILHNAPTLPSLAAGIICFPFFLIYGPLSPDCPGAWPGREVLTPGKATMSSQTCSNLSLVLWEGVGILWLL